MFKAIPKTLWLHLASLFFLTIAFWIKLPATTHGQVPFLGDHGDGFLNLWILERIWQWFSGSSFSTFSDLGIFYPDNKYTLFWTTPLLFPGVLYSFFRSIGVDKIYSYLAINYLALVCVFYTILFLINSVNARTKKLFSLSKLDQHLISFVCAMGPGLQVYWIHFQNPWGIMALLCIPAFFFILEHKYLQATLLLAVSLFLNLATTPYFFILELILIVLMVLIYRREIDFKGLLFSRSFFVTLLITSAPAIYILNGFLHAQSPKFSISIFKQLSVKLADIVYPHFSIWETLAAKVGIVFRGQNHEAPAFLGLVGIFFLIQGLRSMRIATPKPRLLFSFVLVWLALMSTFVYLKVPTPLKYGLQWGLFGLFTFAWLHYLNFASFKLKLKENPQLLLIILGVFILLFSSGPWGSTEIEKPNPSFWSFFHILIPGAESMRAIGRFAILAKILIWAWGFITFRKLRLPLALLLLIEGGRSFYGMGVNFNEIRLNSEEREALTTLLTGPYAVVPVPNIIENPAIMLKFQDLNQFPMVNGYSGKTSQFFDRFINSTAKNESNTLENQIKWLCANEVANIVISFRSSNHFEAPGAITITPGRLYFYNCK